jgi:SAM-dependent methyltransferase
VKAFGPGPRGGLTALDAPATAPRHARLLRTKPFLRRLYESYYAELLAAATQAASGPWLEVGSGSGFFAELAPGLLTLDCRRGTTATLRGSALALPFATGSLGFVGALDVVHHLQDPLAFLQEVQRVLRPGGVACFIEPYISLLSTPIYHGLHHEPCDPRRPDWRLPPGGPLSGADLALAWVLFVRDRATLTARLPGLELLTVRPHTYLLYLLSGGLRTSLGPPGPLFPLLQELEQRLPRAWAPRLASMMTVTWRRLPGPAASRP